MDTIVFSNVIEWSDIIIRVAVAVAVGLAIGIEREISNHPAGMKTHVLVCLGSALASLIATEMAATIYELPEARVDLSRIASGVVSGMGFIGAGAIMKSRDGTMVSGITTAATLWVSACLGLAIGMGYFEMALITLLGVFSATIILKNIERHFFVRKRTRRLDVLIQDKRSTIPRMDEYFALNKITVLAFEYALGAEKFVVDGEVLSHCRYMLKVPKGVKFTSVIKDIAMFESVYEVYENYPGKESGQESMASKGE